jgi:hypothetical protein
MRQPKKPRVRQPSDHEWIQNQFADSESVPKFIFLGVALLITIITWSMIADIGGRSEREHPYPLPSTVVRLGKQEYILQPGAKTRPEDVCWGNGGQYGKRVERVHKFGGQTYVRCGENQKFGVKQTYVSKNYGQALAEIFTSLWFWGITALGFVLCLPWFCWSFRLRWKRWERWEAKEKIKIEYDLEEQRLREVVKAFARCDIDIEEYDAGLQRAYLAGVPPATGD